MNSIDFNKKSNYVKLLYIIAEYPINMKYDIDTVEFIADVLDSLDKLNDEANRVRLIQG